MSGGLSAHQTSPTQDRETQENSADSHEEYIMDNRLDQPFLPRFADLERLWSQSTDVEFPLECALHGILEIYDRDEITWLDRFKARIERYTDEEWLWRPLSSPRKKPGTGHRGLRIRCQVTSSMLKLTTTS